MGNILRDKFNLAVLAIFAIALAVRFIALSSVPPSLSMDEVTFGYAAFSVLKTGQDEYGRTLPLAFQGMGDFKPAVDVYLKVPSIVVFGLNEFALRAPGALLGSLTVLGVAYLLRTLGFTKGSTLFGSLWLALSGWHIVYSRAGYEAVTGLFFVTIGLTWFIQWSQGRADRYLGASVACFSLAVWSYHAERLYIPVLFGVLMYMHRGRLKRMVRRPMALVPSVLVAGLFLVPFLYTTITTQGVRARAEELWLTRDPGIARELHPEGYTSFAQFLFESDAYVLAKGVAGQYLSYMDPTFWFWDALSLTPPGFPDVGLMFVSQLPLFALGVYEIKRSRDIALKRLALLLFVLGPLPGAFARGEPSAIRILLWVPFVAIVMASTFSFIVRQRYRVAIFAVYAVVFLGNLFYFADLYRVQFPNYNADVWHYGYKEVVEEVCATLGQYKKVVITDKYGLAYPSVKTIPHYYYLLHCAVDPKSYRTADIPKSIEFRQPQWRIDSREEGSLLIGSPWDFPEGFPSARIEKTILFPNGKPAFYFVRT